MSDSLVRGNNGSITTPSGSLQNPCYKLEEQMYMCVAANREKKVCEEEFEDYFECLHRGKERLYWNRVNAKLVERRKEYQIAMGTYNPSTYEILRNRFMDYINMRQ